MGDRAADVPGESRGADAVSHVLIRCRGPVPAGTSMRLFPGINDVAVLAVFDGGVEIDITSTVSKITWSVGCGPNEIPTATIEFKGVAIDAEATMVETRTAPP